MTWLSFLWKIYKAGRRLFYKIKKEVKKNGKLE